MGLWMCGSLSQVMSGCWNSAISHSLISYLFWTWLHVPSNVILGEGNSAPVVHTYLNAFHYIASIFYK